MTCIRSQVTKPPILVEVGGFRLPGLGVVVLDEMNPKRGRTGRPWRRAREAVLYDGVRCAHCGEPIIFGLRPSHPLGPSVNHRQRLADGGHPTAAYNLEPMHHGCNSKIGNQPAQTTQAEADPPRRVRSRDW